MNEIKKLINDYTDRDYENDWNLLMDVVEFIESIYDEHHGYFGVYISSNSCVIQGTNLHLAIRNNSNYGSIYYSEIILETKKSSTFLAVIEFAYWYNNIFKTNKI